MHQKLGLKFLQNRRQLRRLCYFHEILSTKPLPSLSLWLNSSINCNLGCLKAFQRRRDFFQNSFLRHSENNWNKLRWISFVGFCRHFKSFMWMCPGNWMYQTLFSTLPQLHLITNRSSQKGCSVKKGVLSNFTKFTGKHLCQSLFFNKVSGLSPVTLFKKRLWHSCSPVNFVKFLRNLFLQSSSGGCFWKWC